MQILGMSVILGLLLVTLFFGWRNGYTYKILGYAREAVYKHAMDNISKGVYYDGNLFEKMIMRYKKHLISYWLYGKYSGVKKEYRELLKPYFDIK